jgi:TatD DNase family protein
VIDFHLHLDLYRNAEEIADETERRKVGALSVTTTPSAWIGTSRLAADRPVIHTALGLHPQLARERRAELPLFDRLLPEARFVGEIGLDGSPELRGIWDDQVAVFDYILAACAGAGGKVLSVHSRRAAGVVLDKLERKSGPIDHIILHWFSGTATELARAIDQDCWFSVGPAMLAAAKGRRLVAAMPRNRVLLETDGPFAQTDKRSLYPWDVGIAESALSELWALQIDEVQRLLRRNERMVIPDGA